MEPIEPEHINNSEPQENINFEERPSILPKPILIQDKKIGFVNRLLA